MSAPEQIAPGQTSAIYLYAVLWINNFADAWPEQNIYPK